jgi:hypothetical protein
MSAKGILFLAGLALAPFTSGVSLILSALIFWHSYSNWKDPGTGIDDSQFDDIIPAHEEAEQRLARIMREAPARRERERQERYNAMDAAQPPLYATYRCSNSMCRHKERLMICHGDTQSCEVCGWATWRV